MYPNLHLTRAAVQEILRNALHAAEISARNRQQSFTFMGALFQFNWVNNPRGAGMRDLYGWFYVKNIGLPFLALLLALPERTSQLLQEHE